MIPRKPDQLKHVVSLDIESTSLLPWRRSILSIGAKNPLTNNEFYIETIPFPDADLDPGALRVNGETKQSILLRREPEYATQGRALAELFAFCAKEGNKRILLGKNPRFDYDIMLEAWVRLTGSEKDFWFTHNTIDWTELAIPYILYKGYTIPETGCSTLFLNRTLRLPEEERPHIAINGARYNIRAFKHIMRLYDDDASS